MACSSTSKLGIEAARRGDCELFRVTENEDLIKSSTVEFIKSLLHKPYTLLWVSLPCTGGSPWQNINKKKPGGFMKWKRNVRRFRQLWRSMENIFDYVINMRLKIIICLEWPRNCAYKFSIKKPWSISTNNHEFFHAFNGILCKNHSIFMHHVLVRTRRRLKSTPIVL